MALEISKLEVPEQVQHLSEKLWRSEFEVKLLQAQLDENPGGPGSQRYKRRRMFQWIYLALATYISLSLIFAMLSFSTYIRAVADHEQAQSQLVRSRIGIVAVEAPLASESPQSTMSSSNSVADSAQTENRVVPLANEPTLSTTPNSQIVAGSTPNESSGVPFYEIPSSVWKVLGNVVLPIVFIAMVIVAAYSLLKYLALVGQKWLLEKLGSNAVKSRAFGLKVLTGSTSLVSISWTALRHWQKLSENSAIEFAFFSGLSAFTFVIFLLLSKSSVIALIVYLCFVATLFLISEINLGDPFAVWTEYTRGLADATIPGGAILFICLIAPVLLVAVTFIVDQWSSRKKDETSSE